MFDSIKTKIDTIVAGIKLVLTGMWDGLSNGLKLAFDKMKPMLNSVAKGINLMIDGANAAIAVTTFGHGPTIPKFKEPLFAARGGTIMPKSGGTLVTVAEAAKPERIEPLDEQGLSNRDRAIIKLLSGGAGGGNVFHIYPSQGMDETELAKMVGRELAFQMRKGAA
jgi:hypothetical protein